ncbi:16S rRNA (uracil(1498)-N(3))-methyltransferase [Thermoclostridium stercorarium]|uniref:16S rRNA (uracil(1498)-N(3))-methyltransferase n=1 Tax=Thermoclostridium stercorarium TaxID=1510 RepID=UPI0022487AE9|nr:16S rRNA (uracil(1498)-N(3))-methyltransferase [Thermoclostridium stercorarium]UZQ84970.1 16S rRNA (uracil(1498)-N(3))-methyltransferase [Thermoclostridium stercorarium]
MHRFLVSPESIKDNTVYITGEDFKHVVQVLRFKAGDRILVFDGTGLEYETELVSVEKGKVTGKIVKAYAPDTEAKKTVILFQGMPKTDKMELIIQKTVELGVSRIVPVYTRYSVVREKDGKIESKLDRWNRISREACKQSRRVLVPTVERPVDYHQALRMWKEIESNESAACSLAVFCYENEDKNCFKELLKCYNIDYIRAVGIFIGPEGGFSEEEVQLAKDYDIIPVGLGKRILRTETAAIAVLSIIMHEMGEMRV